ncbi:hypothetical protein RND81_10G167600 [Saponaria officinalis]|uniref:Oleosin n=1 Tax=Saponaria officinalis TaxID=3572 RepID=A0AAW1I5G1_SAPOF
MSDQQQYTRQQHQQYGGQTHPLTQKLFSTTTTPTTRQAVKFLTASTIGTVLMVLSALTLTGTVISLIVTTPLLVLFSPILVPALITAVLIVTGFVFSGGCGVAAISAMSWIYQYMTGKRPPGADQLDQARSRILNATRDVKDRAQDSMRSGYGGHLSQRSS